MQMTHLELQSRPLVVAGLYPELQQKIFGIKEKAVRPYVQEDNIQIVLTYELSRDLTIVANANQPSFIGLLAEIGGLSIALYIVLRAILLVCNYRAFENYLVSKLYTSMTSREYEQRKFIKVG